MVHPSHSKGFSYKQNKVKMNVFEKHFRKVSKSVFVMVLEEKTKLHFVFVDHQLPTSIYPHI